MPIQLVWLSFCDKFNFRIGSMNSSTKIKKAIFIYGPTASGKTEFADNIAEVLSAEIINMDSAQLYTPLNIGTAKPDWKASSHAQHLFDCMDEPEHITVYAYRQMALATMEAIWSRNKIPIFVGGSGFYLKSMLFPAQDSSSVKSDKPIFDDQSDLWEKLNQVDPERANAIHPHDIYRIKRALEIWHTTGKKPSIYKPVYNPPAPFLLVYVTRKRKDLYARIDERVLTMVKEGWLQEVSSLCATPWELFVQEKGFIGYSELIGYIKHAYDLEYAIELIQQRTRNYAKRQETFWRMLKKEVLEAQQIEHAPKGTIMEFDLTYPGLHLYIKQILHSFDRL